MAEPTGLEPATSNVTGWRSNQLNYDSARKDSGGHRRTRTSNFLLVREAVYQLTYMPVRNIYRAQKLKRKSRKIVKKNSCLNSRSELSSYETLGLNVKQSARRVALLQFLFRTIGRGRAGSFESLSLSKRRIVPPNPTIQPLSPTKVIFSSACLTFESTGVQTFPAV